MQLLELLKIIESINNELRRNNTIDENGHKIEIIIYCCIETKNHLYKGKYKSFDNNTIILVNSFLLDSIEQPIELTESHISCLENNIVSFSYKINEHTICN